MEALGAAGQTRPPCLSVNVRGVGFGQTKLSPVWLSTAPEGNSLMHRFSPGWFIRRIFSLAELIMRDERKQWSRAMKGEAAHLGCDAAAIGFAAGCLRAALLECLKLEANRSAAALCAGLAAGFVFFAHSSIDGSGAWPLLWPLFGGAMTVLLHAQHHERLALRSGAWLGLKAGLVAVLLFAGGSIALISSSENVALSSRFNVLALGGLLGATLSIFGAGALTLLMRRNS